jgi:hypothetical protein
MTPRSQPAYPGETLGLPESGPGSLAPMGRRLAALFVDWLIAYGLALLALGLGAISTNMLSTAILVIWFLLGWWPCGCLGSHPANWRCVSGWWHWTVGWASAGWRRGGCWSRW